MENISTSLFIRNPGLRTLPPGVERYFVRGGGLSVIEVLPEDKLEIINDDVKARLRQLAEETLKLASKVS